MDRIEAAERIELKKIITEYITVCNLNYSVLPDRGRTLHRKIVKHMDIDLRLFRNKSLHLQIWSLNFNYVFEWIGNEEMFLQIIKNSRNIKYDDFYHTEKIVYDIMNTVVANHSSYIASKYRPR